MIGQIKLQEKINKVIDSYPRFSLFVGPKGSGKKTLVKYVCDKLGLRIITFGTSIDDVREAIELAYSQREPICYLFADADGMSVTAKNGLLKITEEPPENAYFVMTLQSMSNTLGTIESRGTLFNLDPYTQDELISYRKYKQYTDTFDNIIRDVCTNTGEVDELFSCDIPAFYKFAETIVSSIHIPKTGNIFKISKQVKSKKDDKGYDAVLLFKTVRNLYLRKGIETKIPQYLQASLVTSKYLRDLAMPTVNTVGTVDMWIMDVRAALRGI